MLDSNNYLPRFFSPTARPEDVGSKISPACNNLTRGKIDIQEIFGSHYQLPELGPLGGYGLANIRDFESPVAHFDIDQRPWQSTYIIILFLNN
jgi:homogentisate 1,2-dioxygenase